MAPEARVLTDNQQNPAATPVGAFLMGWDGATWDRISYSAAGLLVDTELPAAAALADGTANPTVPGVGSFLMGFNAGGTWDRVRMGSSGDADNLAFPAPLQVGAFAKVFNGAGWDRMRTASADALAATGLAAAALMMWNGATWDRVPGAIATGVLVNTELPAAAALADNTATPTVPAIGAFGMVYDGATWDFMRGTALGGVAVQIFDGSGEGPVDVSGEADALGGVTALRVNTQTLHYNGATYDRQRGNLDQTLLTSAARTIATNSADFTNYNGRGLHVVVDLTTFGGAGSITVTIQGKDAISGKYYTLLASAALAAVATTVLRVFPGSTVTANLAANDLLPRVWRVAVTVGDATSHTYSIGASVIL